MSKRRGTRSRLLESGSVALALLAPLSGAWAQAGSPPPSPTSSPAPTRSPAPGPPQADPPRPGQDDIVVTAPTQQSSIDRQTYIVRDTAEARSASAPDILARIPSIEVQQDGSVRLIGAGTANVLIDGRRVNDPATILRTLQGSQIERVEVMTNPGAQFPAQGTGGIVNIITRRSSQNGLGGSATATGGSYGSYDLRLSPTYGAGNWTFTGNLGTGDGGRRAGYERQRYTLAQNGPVLDSSETGRERQDFTYYYGTGTASYRPTDHKTISLSGTVAHTDLSLARNSLLTAAAVAGGSADLASSNSSNFDYRDIGLDYRGTSARPGETFTASVKYTHFAADTQNLFSTDPVGTPATLFRQTGTFDEGSWTAKADYVRPFGGPRRLSFGVQYVWTGDRQAQTAAGPLPDGSPFAASSLVDGSWSEYAAYATYQFGLAGFTLLPGLRLERRDYDLGGTTGTGDLKTTHVFPSFHMERQLAAWLTGDFSYSRRVTYPQIQQLDPALAFQDATTAQAGNPLLRPQFTNSFEAKLHAQLTHHSVDLTAFRRSTDDVLSQRGELDANGVLVIRPVNFGAQTLTGAELAARGPLLPGLRYVLTANVADNGLDLDGAGPLAARHSVTWSGTAQLEYKDGQDGRRGADRVNLGVRYFGPNDTGFTRTSAIAVGSLTWTHGITDRLQSVATLTQVLLVDGFEIDTTGATSRSREFRNPAWGRFTVSLTWSFRPPGQGPQVRPQPQAGPPGIPGGPQ